MTEMQTARLTTSESVMLDIIRVVAACVVAFGHLTRNPFSTGWTDLTFLARDAVSVFFVLSGFVIRYVTVRRRTSFGHYLGDRASRIYSVAIPALLLAWITDSIARHINPAFYSTWAIDYSHAPLRILINLVFCGQLWTHAVTPLSDSPYWSINYEVAYYVGYGCFFYLARRSRWLWLAALCLFVGPRIIYLAPLWIAGCVAHDLYQRWTRKGTAETWINWLLLVPVCVFGFVIVEAPSHPGLTYLSALSAFPHLYSMMTSVWVRPPEVVFGFLWVIIFLRLLLFARRFNLNETSAIVRRIRFVSEGTFPIYLTHFPLYILIAACIPYHHGSPTQKIVIFLAVITFGVLAGHSCNLLKEWIRSLLFSDQQVGAAHPHLQKSTP
jgi:peptidoglycan/LPS O-acetylase OafA/YrhL